MSESKGGIKEHEWKRKAQMNGKKREKVKEAYGLERMIHATWKVRGFQDEWCRAATWSAIQSR